MKVKDCISGTLIATCMLTGCMSSSVGWIDKGEPPETVTGGTYAIDSSIKGIDADKLRKDYGVKIGEIDKKEVPARDSALPVKVSATSGKVVDVTGAMGTVNNFFSVCTLGIWPYVSTETCDYTVEISSPMNKSSYPLTIGKRKWSSFILPIAALPCPGWGDWRGSSDGFEFYQQEAAGTVITSVLTEKFYNDEMAKYLSDRQKKYNVKQVVIKKLQSVLDNE